MFRAFFTFDLRLQLSSPLLWVTVLLFSLMAFFSNETVSLGGTIGNANFDAPALTLQVVAIFTMMGMFFITLFMAQPLLRDHEQGVADLFFSKPIHPRDYVLGRFAAGFTVSVALFVLILVLMAVGTRMPWIDANRLGPFTALPYAYALLVVVLPNLLFIGGGLALLACATRSILMVYVGLVGYLALWGASRGMVEQLDSHWLSALLDPLCMSTLSSVTRYWVVTDYNTRLPELTGPLLANRLLWSTLGLLMLGLAVASFRAVRSGTRRAWYHGRAVAPVAAPLGDTPRVASAVPGRHVMPATGWRVVLRQFWHLVGFDTLAMLKSSAFIAFVLLAAFQYWANLTGGMDEWGGVRYPTTSWMLQIAGRGMGLFLSLVIVFYAGELIDKERAAKMHEVTAACPTPDFLPLLAKCAALITVAVAFVLALTLVGMAYQLRHGYTHFELDVYAGGLLLELLPYVLMGLLALTLQVLAHNKYVGYLLIVVLIVLKMSAGALGMEDNLLVFGGAPKLAYSDMDGYGNNLAPHLWFQTYWLFFCAVLVTVAAALWVRGTAPSFPQRLQRAGLALRGPLGLTLAISTLAFAATGAWIFYNTHLLNTYRSTNDQLNLKATYEKIYHFTEALPQPKITAVDVALDMSPKADQLAFTVRYRVTNPHDEPINELHVMTNRQLTLTPPPFASRKAHDPRFGVSVFKLKEPLLPGQSADWELVLTQTTAGFTNQGSESLLLGNGTFLHSYRLLPSFGYNRDAQILDPKERSKRGLPVLPAMAARDDTDAQNMPFNAGNGVDASDDADWITFNTTVSTDPDQVALAPGYLQKEWQANGRRYFHYQMDGKMAAYAAWLSGRWQIKRDQWRGIPIEVYADAKHPYNVDQMLSASKAALEYCSTAYAPYQHKQLRIVEFPSTMGYFAESFANTVPYAEHLGFVADLRDPEALNMVHYVTAHEVAHQWWGHQVMPANVQGATMVVESLAQYTAMMVMQKTYGKAKMRQFLKRELDMYLVGRGRDSRSEQPLGLVENQAHIHYSKGAMAFYRLSQEMGEDALNRALQKFLAATAFQGPPYTTSAQLLDFIRAEAGPQHAQLITDLFEKITLHDNRVTEARAVKRADGRYDVSFSVSTAKFYADGKGVDRPAPLDDWMDVAVLARPTGGSEKDEKVLVLERTHITSAQQTFTFTVNDKPFEVGIDPYNQLIDRISGDNRKRLTVD